MFDPLAKADYHPNQDDVLASEVNTMFPTVVVVASICCVSSVERYERLYRDLWGHKPEYFEKHIKPLVAGMAKAQKLTLHEGLARQPLSEQLRISQLSAGELATELKDKKAIKSRGFHFYEEPSRPKTRTRRLSWRCAPT